MAGCIFFYEPNLIMAFWPSNEGIVSIWDQPDIMKVASYFILFHLLVNETSGNEDGKKIKILTLDDRYEDNVVLTKLLRLVRGRDLIEIDGTGLTERIVEGFRLLN